MRTRVRTPPPFLIEDVRSRTGRGNYSCPNDSCVVASSFHIALCLLNLPDHLNCNDQKCSDRAVKYLSCCVLNECFFISMKNNHNSDLINYFYLINYPYYFFRTEGNATPNVKGWPKCFSSDLAIPQFFCAKIVAPSGSIDLGYLARETTKLLSG